MVVDAETALTWWTLYYTFVELMPCMRQDIHIKESVAF